MNRLDDFWERTFAFRLDAFIFIGAFLTGVVFAGVLYAIFLLLRWVF